MILAASPGVLLTGRSAGLSGALTKKEHIAMTTKLDKPLKRELDVEGEAYVLVISPEGLKLTRKGRRKGQELAWKDLVSGDAALATALNASLKQPTT
jgi:hypothetical protein